MSIKAVGFCIVILACALSVSAQRKTDERGMQQPTEEELAAFKRMWEDLQHPTLITMRLLYFPHDDTSAPPTDTPAAFKPGDLIELRLTISHTFSEPLKIEEALDPYRDVRPELFRDGELLPYKKETQEYVERTENTPDNGSKGMSTFLPGRESLGKSVRLEKWYEPLGPGHYQITVRRRFASCGPETGYNRRP